MIIVVGGALHRVSGSFLAADPVADFCELCPVGGSLSAARRGGGARGGIGAPRVSACVCGWVVRARAPVRPCRCGEPVECSRDRDRSRLFLPPIERDY